jgi:hypothetical protein
VMITACLRTFRPIARRADGYYLAIDSGNTGDADAASIDARQ